MNSKNQHTESRKKVSSNPTSTSSPTYTTPKLTVQNIIDKFVKPSTHRKVICLSSGEKNKK